MTRTSFRGDDRAVSVTVSYALNLAVATLLISSLLFVTGDHLRSQQEETIRTELKVVGEQFATRLTGADRMVAAGGSTVVVRVEMPPTVAGSGYRVNVTATADESHVRLVSDDPSVTARVAFRNTTAVENETFVGGDVRIVYQGGDSLEVTVE